MQKLKIVNNSQQIGNYRILENLGEGAFAKVKSKFIFYTNAFFQSLYSQI